MKPLERMSSNLYVTANSHFHDLLGILTNLLEWRKIHPLIIAIWLSKCIRNLMIIMEIGQKLIL